MDENIASILRGNIRQESNVVGFFTKFVILTKDGQELKTETETVLRQQHSIPSHKVKNKVRLIKFSEIGAYQPVKTKQNISTFNHTLQNRVCLSMTLIVITLY